MLQAVPVSPLFPTTAHDRTSIKADGSPAVTLGNLTLGYDGHPAVHHLDATFAQGSLTAIVGPNGAGKSTLLRAIAGHMRPLGGRIDIAPAAAGLAYLPQQAAIDRSFPIRVEEFVSLGLWTQTGMFRRNGASAQARVRAAIARVGLAGFESRTLDRLSGGQLQRVMFARVIVQDCPLILLDEPFNAIDTRTVGDLVALIASWHREGRTIVSVLHDTEVVRAHFPDTLLLARDMIAFGPTETVLTADNLHKARAMSEAWDDQAPLCADAA